MFLEGKKLLVTTTEYLINIKQQSNEYIKRHSYQKNTKKFLMTTWKSQLIFFPFQIPLRNFRLLLTKPNSKKQRRARRRRQF